MKKFLIGFIVGICISGGVVFAGNQIAANIADLPILIDGDNYTPLNPVIVINNTSYISTKDVGKISGKSINWNNSLKRIEIGDDNSNYKYENLTFKIAGIRAKTAQFDDRFKPKDGNGLINILVKITNTGSELAYPDKNDFYIKTYGGEKYSTIPSPEDNYFKGICLGTRDHNTISLSFEVPKDDINKKPGVTLLYKPAKSENECNTNLRIKH